MGVISRFKYVFNSMINMHSIRKYGISIGKKSRMNGIVTFICDEPHSISIGDSFRVNSGRKYNQIGGDTRCILSTLHNGKIQIGNNVGISNTCIVAMESVTIHNDVRIGGSCKLYDNDFHSLTFQERMNKIDKGIEHKPINICDGAFIGAHCIILKGVTIGKHSVIGAGSVVTKDIPDGQVWAGNPARYIREINE